MPADTTGFALELVLVAFAGGALGASIGALPSLSLAGGVIVVGEVGNVIGRAVEAGGGGAGSITPLGITDLIGFGPALGPHVAFAGGVAATAYAARKGYLETQFEYHEAKHVTLSLGTKPDVVVVGGLFGVLGYLLAGLSARFGLPWSPVFASVVVSAFVHRLVLGYPLAGRFDSSVLDMSPFESDQRRIARDGSDPARSEARLLVEPWLPHQYRWSNVAVIGTVAGVFGAFVALQTGSSLLAFGIAATSLIFLTLGMTWTPIVYHMVLPASIAALALSASSPVVAIAVGGAFGLFSGLVGEVAQRLLYAHADTHLDPAAVGIVVSTLVIALLEVGGVWTTSIPTPV